MADQPFTLLYDCNGAPVGTFNGSTFAPVTGRPAVAAYNPQGGVLGLGLDYGATVKAQAPKVDALGNQYVVPQSPGGGSSLYQATSSVGSANAAYGPVLMGLYGTTVGPVALDAYGSVLVTQTTLPTFSAVATAVAPTTNKSLLALVNKSTAGSVVRIVSVFSQNSSQATGGLLSTYSEVAFEVRPITGVSATGTSVAALAYDSADALDSNISVSTGATVTGDTRGALRRWISSNDGATAGTTASEGVTADQQGREPWVTRADLNSKQIVVRPGTGIHLKCASTSTQGALDITFVFTVASA